MVTNTTVATELVESEERRDRRGRRITPAGRREELVAEWRQSGLTQATFARREGINYTTFCPWVQQSRPADARAQAASAAKVSFAEVAMPATMGVPAVEVRLADGTLVRGASAREVAAVVRALHG